LNYQQTIDYLYARLPMFSRIGASAIKKDLTNTLELCKRLGDPQRKLKTIHVAGTNGKGSTSHMLAAILQTAGYRTGLYTSPHLKDFRERIRVDGDMISRQFVVDFTERVRPWLDEIEPSFFEITVAMALTYFTEQQVDVAVIETGLGGRLDSTNVITPELSVITNIGWDHMNILGNSLEMIAGEKAGIIKPGIPVVIGETQEGIRNVFLEKAGTSSPIVFADRQRSVKNFSLDGPWLCADIEENMTGEQETYCLDLQGVYQLRNLLTVLEAVHRLRMTGWKIGKDHVTAALRQVRTLTGLRGRWEVVSREPMVVIDVGHNEDGIRQVVDQIALTPHRHLHIVIGMVKDKEVDQVLKLLPKEASYYFTRAAVPRALDAGALKEKATSLGLRGETYPDVNLAIRAAKTGAGKEDLILVCGSVFLVGEVEIMPG
jgi:dihydrofolate synthase/folylpolyglutamate synthase